MDVKKAVCWLQDVLTMACDYAMPRSKQTHHPNAYWWNTQIAELRGECARARKKWQKTKRDGKSINEILNRESIYREIKKELRNAIKKTKAYAWEELIQTIERDPWDLPYRNVIKKLRRSSPNLTEILDNEILTEIINKLFPNNLDNEENDKAIYNEEATHNEATWKDEYEVSTDELISAMKKMPGANKAPGMDGFKSTFIKRIPEKLQQKLRHIYTMCIKQGHFPSLWKEAILILIPKGVLDLRAPKARPICLLSELGKLLERIIEERLQDWMLRNPMSAMSPNQFGFRRKTSTCDALCIVQELVSEAMEGGEVVIGAG